MNNKIKTGTLGLVALLTTATIGIGTTIALRTTDEGKGNLLSTNDAKSAQWNFAKIATPSADALDKMELKKIQEKINNNIKGFFTFAKGKYIPIKNIELVKLLNGKNFAITDDVKKVIKDFFKDSKSWKMKANINTMKFTKHKEDLERFEKIAENKIADINKAKAMVKKAQTELATAKTKTPTLIKAASDAATMVKNAETAANKAQTELATAKSRTIVLKEKAMNAQTKVRSINKDIESLKNEINSLAKKTNSLINSIQQAKLIANTANEQLRKLKNRLADEQAKNIELEKELNDAKTNEQNIVKALKKIQTELAAAKAKTSSLEKAASDAATMVKNAETAANKALKDLTDEKLKTTTLNSNLTNASNAKRDLETELNNKNNDLTTAKKAKEQLKKKEKCIYRKLTSVKIDHGNATNQKNDALILKGTKETTVRNLKNRLMGIDEEIKQKEAKISAIAAKVAGDVMTDDEIISIKQKMNATHQKAVIAIQKNNRRIMESGSWEKELKTRLRAKNEEWRQKDAEIIKEFNRIAEEETKGDVHWSSFLLDMKDPNAAKKLNKLKDALKTLKQKKRRLASEKQKADTELTLAQEDFDKKAKNAANLRREYTKTNDDWNQTKQDLAAKTTKIKTLNNEKIILNTKIIKADEIEQKAKKDLDKNRDIIADLLLKQQKTKNILDGLTNNSNNSQLELNKNKAFITNAEKKQKELNIKKTSATLVVNTTQSALVNNNEIIKKIQKDINIKITEVSQKNQDVILAEKNKKENDNLIISKTSEKNKKEKELIDANTTKANADQAVIDNANDIKTKETTKSKADQALIDANTTKSNSDQAVIDNANDIKTKETTKSKADQALIDANTTKINADQAVQIARNILNLDAAAIKKIKLRNLNGKLMTTVDEILSTKELIKDGGQVQKVIVKSNIHSDKTIQKFKEAWENLLSKKYKHSIQLKNTKTIKEIYEEAKIIFDEGIVKQSLQLSFEKIY